MRRKIGFWEVFSIGVGGMIGGGIFAVLGLSIQLSKGAAPFAFFLAGIIALLTAYSYAKLSVRFPSEGGTIEFIVRAYGNGIFSGGMNILLLLSYVVMISLYAYAFGSYGANFLALNQNLARHVLASLAILIFTFVNALGAYISGKTEEMLVAFKLAILISVVGAGLFLISPDRLSMHNWAKPLSVIAGGMVIFLAYEGFELISNAGYDVENPSILPKAYFSSVILVILVYIAVAVVTVGNIPLNEIVNARDYALAIAAKPSLGEFGFILVTFAALASTSSAINATLFGTARVSYMVAKYGELPGIVERKVWKQGYEGLFFIGGLALLISNIANLESISTAGSGGFLLIFFFVNIAALKLRKSLKVNPLIPVLSSFLTLLALAILAYRMSQQRMEDLSIFAGLIFASFLVELLYRNLTGREIEERLDRRLVEMEESLKNWSRWIDGFIDAVDRVFEEAEVYVVGSVARGEVEKSHDIDLLILTDKPPEKGRKKVAEDELRVASGIKEGHLVHVHFGDKKKRVEVLKKAKHYIPLKKS